MVARACAGGLLVLLVGGIFAAVFFGGGIVGAGDNERHWLPAAVTSPLFIACAAVALVSAVLAAWLAGALVLAGRRQRSHDGAEGGAMIEFALVLPFLLMIVLVMIQSALLMGAQLCVNYAAYSAARSAVVQIPSDRGYNEPPNMPGSSKMERVRLAALWAVLPISSGGFEHTSPDGQTLRDGLERFFRNYGEDVPGWVDGRLGRKLAYARAHTEVSLTEPTHTSGHTLPSGETYTGYATHADVRAEVEHTIYLSVPFAARMFAVLGGGVRLGPGEHGMPLKAHCTLINQGQQNYVDVEVWDD